MGSPAHPSYPAGHAVSNGAFATVLKVNLASLFNHCTAVDVFQFGRYGRPFTGQQAVGGLETVVSRLGWA